MIGHDVVPHIDELHSTNVSNTNYEVQVEHSHFDLGHIFEHFQHSSNESTLKYVTGALKNLNIKKDILQNYALIVDIDNQFIWHTNFEKQRFRDYPIIPYFTTLSSHTLRGPPSC
jgi:type IV secretory pathway VirB6-like protein